MVLLGFGAVCICGVGESAWVACVLVVCHVSLLTVLILWGFAYGCEDGFATLSANYSQPFPTIRDGNGAHLASRNAGAALYFGYCTGLLGITGFETAANYVEEMESPATFISTVNWMW